jgi:hypothetical protein
MLGWEIELEYMSILIIVMGSRSNIFVCLI